MQNRTAPLHPSVVPPADDLVVDDPDAPILELPRAGPTALTGLYYILPIVILIWCILIGTLLWIALLVLVIVAW